MAYLLRAQNGQYITLSLGVTIGSSDDFSIRINATPSANSNYYRALGGSSFTDNAPRVLIFGGGRTRLTDDSGSNLEWFLSYDLTTIETIEFRRTGGELEFLLNGVVQSGTITGNTSSFDDFSVVNGNFGTTSVSSTDYKLIEFEVNGVVTNRYDPSASGGSGSILPDTIGGNDGTLVNFPTDNSQWVFYSDASGVDADVAYTVSSPSFSASASASLPQPVSYIAYTASAPSFSVTADASLPNPVANANVTVNSPLFSVAASATSPNINASADFSVSAPEFSVNASSTFPNPVSDVSFDVESPSFSVSATATLPQPVADIAFNQGKPSFSVSASPTITGNVATCLIDLEAPQFNASAQATFPQPDCDIDFTTSAPTFSVVAFAGGNAIIKVEGKTIELPYRSRAVYITEG